MIRPLARALAAPSTWSSIGRRFLKIPTNQPKECENCKALKERIKELEVSQKKAVQDVKTEERMIAALAVGLLAMALWGSSS